MSGYRDDDYLPSDINSKVFDLVEAIEAVLNDDIEDIKKDRARWQQKYYEVIDKPCKHISTGVIKSDRVRVVCNCCLKTINEYDSFEDAASGKESKKQ